jgi:hypothetical protein
MDIKKIRNSIPLAEFFLIVVLIMFIFFGMFQWWGYNLTNSGQGMNSTYSNLNANLTESQGDLNNRVKNIRTDLSGTKEAREGVFVTAINGIRGLWNVFILPLQSIDLFDSLITTFTNAFDFLPTWALTLFSLALIIGLVMIIFSIFAGASNNISH